jgi:hypothetical protein
MAKAKKSKAKKSTKKKAKKPARRAAAKARRAPTRSKGKSKKVKKAVARKAAPRKAKKAAPKKKKQIVGEGDYAASRAFDKDQAAFVKKNKAKIPAMGKDAEKALDGPEGDGLRAAEAEAMNRSMID